MTSPPLRLARACLRVGRDVNARRFLIVFMRRFCPCGLDFWFDRGANAARILSRQPLEPSLDADTSVATLAGSWLERPETGKLRSRADRLRRSWSQEELARSRLSCGEPASKRAARPSTSAALASHWFGVRVEELFRSRFPGRGRQGPGRRLKFPAATGRPFDRRSAYPVGKPAGIVRTIVFEAARRGRL